MLGKKKNEQSTWTWSEKPEESVAAIGGEIDFSGSAKVREALHRFIKRTSGEVSLDLEGLEYLDSSGLAVLIEARRVLQEQGRSIRIVAVRDQVRKIFELTQVAELFGI